MKDVPGRRAGSSSSSNFHPQSGKASFAVWAFCFRHKNGSQIPCPQRQLDSAPRNRLQGVMRIKGDCVRMGARLLSQTRKDLSELRIEIKKHRRRASQISKLIFPSEP
jgi:hypothetical protein